MDIDMHLQVVNIYSLTARKMQRKPLVSWTIVGSMDVQSTRNFLQSLIFVKPVVGSTRWGELRFVMVPSLLVIVLFWSYRHVVCPSLWMPRWHNGKVSDLHLDCRKFDSQFKQCCIKSSVTFQTVASVTNKYNSVTAACHMTQCPFVCGFAASANILLRPRAMESTSNRV